MIDWYYIKNYFSLSKDMIKRIIRQDILTHLTNNGIHKELLKSVRKMTIWKCIKNLIGTSKMEYTNNKKINEDLLYFISTMSRQSHDDILSHTQKNV